MILLTLILALPAFAASKPGSVASVEYIAPSPRTLDQVAIVKRGSKQVPASDILKNGLRTGDQIFITDRDAVLAIRMITTGRVIATRRRGDSATTPRAGTSLKEPDLVIDAHSIPGVPPRAYAFFADLWKSANRMANAANFVLSGPDQNGEEYMLAASRGLDRELPTAFCPNKNGKSNEPLRFRIPGMAPYDNGLMPGRRSLFVAWRGGVEPYSIRVLDEKKAVLAEISDVRGRCAATLPAVDLKAGSVSLILTDGNKTKTAAMDINLDVPVPPMPKAIADAKFPASVATLYYATWLTTQDNGRWTWEAIQRVAAMGCQSLGAREWLSRYSDMSQCPAQ